MASNPKREFFEVALFDFSPKGSWKQALGK